ncbi:hypothetical protein N2152v2_008146 [Parachlorella kessleri]
MGRRLDRLKVNSLGIAVLLTSKRLHRLFGQQIFAEVSVHVTSLRSLRQLAQALGRHQGMLRTLQITHCWLGDRREARRHRAVRAIFAALRGAESLQWLSLTLPADPGRLLATWPASLPVLRSLALVCHAPLTLPQAFSSFTSLQSLEIYEDSPLLGPSQPSGLKFWPDSLPRSLRRLCLATCNMQVVPSEVLKLALFDFWPSEEVLGELAGLPSLRTLDLSCLPDPYKQRAGWAPHPPDAQQACLLYLAQLERVQELRLKHCGMRSVPEEILTMPKLEVLHIDGSHNLSLPQLDPTSAARCQLRSITLDACAAVTSSGSLARMGSLSTLHLTACPLAVPVRNREVEQVQAALPHAMVAAVSAHERCASPVWRFALARRGRLWLRGQTSGRVQLGQLVAQALDRGWLGVLGAMALAVSLL